MKVAPGRYEARVVADTTRPLRFAVETDTGRRGVTRILVSDPAAEYRLAEPNEPTARRSCAHHRRDDAADAGRARAGAAERGRERGTRSRRGSRRLAALGLADIRARRLWR